MNLSKLRDRSAIIRRQIGNIEVEARDALRVLLATGPASWPRIRAYLIGQVDGIGSTEDALLILHSALGDALIRLDRRDADGTGWYALEGK